MAIQSSNRRVDDRYDLIEPLGRGGMGVVWLAEDTLLQRRVAVKQVEFPPGVPAEEIESLRERVLREARSAGRLNHPNVTTIFDVVRDEGTTWIVMEYVDAPTLTDLVSRDGALSPPRAAAVGKGVLSALEAAHAAGIVHRDVKPANVMVAPDGTVKLADFGVAAVQGDAKLTLTGLIIGSPSFMAPEQAQEGVSTAASDMWGLGATLYYAVEGAPPFDRGTAIPTLAAVTYEPPRPMERAGALQPVIERLLAKDPADRPTAPELHTMLGEVAGDGGAPTVVAPDAAPRTMALPPPVAASGAPVDEWLPPPRRRATVWPWVITAALLAVLALVFLPGLLAPDGEPTGGRDVARDQTAGQDDPQQGQQPRAEQSPAASADDEPAVAADGEAAVDPDQPAVASPAPSGDTAVPAGWTTYDIADTGSTVAYPQHWTAEPSSDTATDLIDPAGGRYLRVDYTDSPGDDAVADWERQSDAFAAGHEGYSEIAIEPYDYPGADTSALWEYTYTEGGEQLHAYNLAIVSGGHGYALNFQTREDQWEDSLQLWDQLVAGFRPAT